MDKLPILRICDRCGAYRVFAQPCDCDAPQHTPPARGQLPTTEHHKGLLITEQDVKEAAKK